MKRSQVVWLLVGVAVFAGLAWLYLPRASVSSGNTTAAATTNSSQNFQSAGSGMETYTNSRFGFSFTFPSDLSVTITTSDAPNSPIGSFGTPSHGPTLSVTINPTVQAQGFGTPPPPSCLTVSGKSSCTLFAGNGQVTLNLTFASRAQLQDEQRVLANITGSFRSL